jgi:hypothetical protein
MRLLQETANHAALAVAFQIRRGAAVAAVSHSCHVLVPALGTYCLSLRPLDALLFVPAHFRLQHRAA